MPPMERSRQRSWSIARALSLFFTIGDCISTFLCFTLFDGVNQGCSQGNADTSLWAVSTFHYQWWLWGSEAQCTERVVERSLQLQGIRVLCCFNSFGPMQRSWKMPYWFYATFTCACRSTAPSWRPQASVSTIMCHFFMVAQVLMVL